MFQNLTKHAEFAVNGFDGFVGAQPRVLILG